MLSGFEALKCVANILVGRGYATSANNKLSLDGAGNPVPWITYPAFDYIRGLDLSQKSIFEFGAGCSTLYWATVCANVLSVESNREWFKKVRDIAPSNCKILLREDEENYLAVILEPPNQFDVIIIDGAFNRRKMAERAIQKLAPGGFIVLDNSDCHVRAAKVLRESGLIQVDMNGFAPGCPSEQTTSFFFKRDFDFQPKGEWQPVKTTWSMGHFVDE